jgi:hypothetical protein
MRQFPRAKFRESRPLIGHRGSKGAEELDEFRARMTFKAGMYQIIKELGHLSFRSMSSGISPLRWGQLEAETAGGDGGRQAQRESEPGSKREGGLGRTEGGQASDHDEQTWEMPWNQLDRQRAFGLAGQ